MKRLVRLTVGAGGGGHDLGKGRGYGVTLNHYEYMSVLDIGHQVAQGKAQTQNDRDRPTTLIHMQIFNV